MRLASYRLGSEPHELVRLMKGGTRVAVIANAIDNRAPEERRYRLDREMNDFADLGLEADELDLRDYFGREDELREQLSTVEAVFVRGGDVLILALAIRESGMGEILKERLAEDTLVFAGYSAGSCVLGPRLPVFEPSAPPDVPAGYPAEAITEGLSIVPFSFAPHYGAETGGAGSRSETDFYIENHVPFVALRDHQVLIVDGEHTRVAGR